MVGCFALLLLLRSGVTRFMRSAGWDYWAELSGEIHEVFLLTRSQ